jgi:CO/xanthine dehydrogenase FAD-binding subunit
MFDHVESFHRPRSLGEAIRLLHARGSGARVVAGGTDVVVEGDHAIRTLVDITRLGLTYIRQKDDLLAIGATTTLAAIEHSPAVRRVGGGILSRAAATCGSVQLRNMATLGGNVANASPAADTVTPLMTLGAMVVIAGGSGRGSPGAAPRQGEGGPAMREMALADFYSGPGRTALGKGLLVEILIPARRGAPRTGWSFQKLGRTEIDISLVNVAAGVHTDANGVCVWARIALGAAAPMPLRAPKAESLLAGRKLDAALIRQASELASKEVDPVTDARASAEYRREMSRVLAKRALEECAERAGCRI